MSTVFGYFDNKNTMHTGDTGEYAIINDSHTSFLINGDDVYDILTGEKKCSLANTNGVVDAEISNDGDLYTISSNVDYNEIVYQYDLPNIKKFYWTDLNNGNVSYRDKYDNVSDYTGRVVKEVTDTAILIYKNGELTQTIPLSSAISAVKEEIRKALDSYQNVDCAGESYPSERESERPSSYTTMITMTVEKEHIDRDGKCWATVSFWAYGNCYPYISHEYNTLDADFTDSDVWINWGTKYHTNDYKYYSLTKKTNIVTHKEIKEWVEVSLQNRYVYTVSESGLSLVDKEEQGYMYPILIRTVWKNELPATALSTIYGTAKSVYSDLAKVITSGGTLYQAGYITSNIATQPFYSKWNSLASSDKFVSDKNTDTYIMPLQDNFSCSVGIESSDILENDTVIIPNTYIDTYAICEGKKGTYVYCALFGDEVSIYDTKTMETKKKPVCITNYRLRRFNNIERLERKISELIKILGGG